MELMSAAAVLLILCVVLLFLGVVVLYMTSGPPNLHRYESEKYFLNGAGGDKKQWPSLDDAPTVGLSVIIPSYNEEIRLPVMMDEAMEYLHQRSRKKGKPFTYEVIIVDDGSTDKTTEVGLRYTEKYGSDAVRVLTLAQNRGKGGAVRMGMLSARGELLLFADADGATRFSDLDKLEDVLAKLKVSEDNMAVICGSRAHLEEESIATRSLFRTILMHGFHFAVWFLCVRNIRDTQCGFKLLTRNAARLLFKNLHVDRWAFDVDLLHIAQHFSVPVAEVPVRWTEIDGSKITPVLSWIQMGKDLLMIRLKYLIGAWKMERVKTD